MTKRLMTPEAAEAHNMRIRANRLVKTGNPLLAAVDLAMTHISHAAPSFMRIPLPFPPSANRYWRHDKGRTHLSAAALAYRKAVKAAIGPVKRIEGDIKVSLDYWYPDKRKRDLGNLEKQLSDALVLAGVMEDDSQIVDLHLRKLGHEKGGSVLVTIEKV